ncbi:MAG: DUF6325 family protein [Actinomycetes bacterium]
MLVIGFDEPRFSGVVLAELARLKAEGIVQLVDLFVVERNLDGELHAVSSVEAFGPAAGDVAASLLTESSGREATPHEHDLETVWSLAAAIPAGTTAVVSERGPAPD